MLKQFARHSDALGRGRQVADTPPRHGDAFGKAVDRDDARRNVGAGGRADVLVPVVEDFLVHLVGQQHDVGVTEHEAAQDFRFGTRQHPAGGVVGIVDDEQARFARHLRFQSLFGDAVAPVGIATETPPAACAMAGYDTQPGVRYMTSSPGFTTARTVM